MKAGHQGVLVFGLKDAALHTYSISTYSHSSEAVAHTPPHVTPGKHSQAPDRSVWSNDLLFFQLFVLWTTSERGAYIYYYLRAFKNLYPF